MSDGLYVPCACGQDGCEHEDSKRYCVLHRAALQEEHQYLDWRRQMATLTVDDEMLQSLFFVKEQAEYPPAVAEAFLEVYDLVADELTSSDIPAVYAEDRLLFWRYPCFEERNRFVIFGRSLLLVADRELVVFGPFQAVPPLHSRDERGRLVRDELPYEFLQEVLGTPYTRFHMHYRALTGRKLTRTWEGSFEFEDGRWVSAQEEKTCGPALPLLPGRRCAGRLNGAELEHRRISFAAIETALARIADLCRFSRQQQRPIRLDH